MSNGPHPGVLGPVVRLHKLHGDLRRIVTALVVPCHKLDQYLLVGVTKVIRDFPDGSTVVHLGNYITLAGNGSVHIPLPAPSNEPQSLVWAGWETCMGAYETRELFRQCLLGAGRLGACLRW